MKKMIFAMTLSLLLIAFGSAAQAQIPKEGSISCLAGDSGMHKALSMGKERVQVNYELLGVFISETGEGFVHNASVRCMGTLHAVKGVHEGGGGGCVHTCPDGDQWFTVYTTSGQLGRALKVTGTIVGGTGKLSGIQGREEWNITEVRPAAEGTFQESSIIKISYKLP